MELQNTITVKGKVVGRTRPAFPDWSVPIPADLYGSGQMLLRDLITRIVLEEVEGYRSRQSDRRLIRILTPSEIERGVASGRVVMDGRGEEVPEQQVDPDAAVAAAIQAFEDQFYYVFIDDVQGESLDQPVRLQPDSTVTFLRLVPLVGG